MPQPDREDADAYIERLDETLRLAHRQIPAPRLTEMVRSSGGAFPSLVVERLDALSLPWSLTTLETAEVKHPRPELHPLDFEWHFDPSTVDSLAHLIGGRYSNLIGLPTVAVAVSRPFTLIERNPFVMFRNPALTDRGQVLIRDVLALEPGGVTQAPVTAFDPPWYPGETMQWFVRAVEMTAPRGTVIFVLFPSLLRPGARAERNEILSFVEQFGRVVVHASAATYYTPRFELEALRAARVPPLNNWRAGDIVTVDLLTGGYQQLPLSAAALGRDPWDTFNIQGQVIKVRRETPQGSSSAALCLSPLPGYQDWRYPSVSLREPGRQSIDFWTSRNRIAKVNDHSRVRQALHQLSISTDPKRSLGKYEWHLRRPEAAMWRQVLMFD